MQLPRLLLASLPLAAATCVVVRLSYDQVQNYDYAEQIMGQVCTDYFHSPDHVDDIRAFDKLRLFRGVCTRVTTFKANHRGACHIDDGQGSVVDIPWASFKTIAECECSAEVCNWE